MIEIKISDQGNATTTAEGKAIDLMFQCTVAIASIISMAKENFGKDLPNIEEFIVTEAQRIAKTKEHIMVNRCEPSEKHSDNPMTEMFRKFFGGGVIFGAA